MTDKIDVHLDGPRQINKAPKVPVTDIIDNDGNVKHVDIRRPPKQDGGGSIRVYASKGQQLMFDDKTGELHTTGGIKCDDKNCQKVQDTACEQDIMTCRENLDLSGTNEQAEIPNDPDSEAMPSQSDPASAKIDRQQVQTRQTKITLTNSKRQTRIKPWVLTLTGSIILVTTVTLRTGMKAMNSMTFQLKNMTKTKKHLTR